MIDITIFFIEIQRKLFISFICSLIMINIIDRITDLIIRIDFDQFYTYYAYFLYKYSTTLANKQLTMNKELKRIKLKKWY